MPLTEPSPGGAHAVRESIMSSDHQIIPTHSRRTSILAAKRSFSLRLSWSILACLSQLLLVLAVKAQSPGNDMFVNAFIDSASAVTGTNIGATKELGEPITTSNGGGKSFWWRWTPTA